MQDGLASEHRVYIFRAKTAKAAFWTAIVAFINARASVINNLETPHDLHLWTEFFKTAIESGDIRFRNGADGYEMEVLDPREGLHEGDVLLATEYG